MKTLCIDIDGTVADSIAGWLRIANEEYMIGKSKNDINDYNLEKITGIKKETVYEIYRRVWDNYAEIPPVDEYVSAVIEKLHKSFIIKIVTGTVGDEKAVKAWLKLNNIPYDEFVHVRRSIEKLNAEGDAFIEDDPAIARALAEKGRYVIMIEQSWNKGQATEGVKVVRNWLEVEKLLLRR